MKCFQIEKNEVLIIDGEKQYTDTVENFKSDSGIQSLPVRVWYNDEQPNVVIKQDADSEEIWKEYPISEYDDYIAAIDEYIAAIDEYIAAKEKREYVPPTEEEKAQAARQQLDAEYESEKSALADSLTTAILRGDTDTQASIQADYKDLEASYAESVSALNS